jgi:hydroxypyruvate isomerase
MLRFAANLSLMYTEHAFMERFAAAARDGFAAVECQFPYEHGRPAELAALLADAGQQLVLLNAPAGDWAGGERGLAALPGREDEFRRGFLEQALPYAAALGCPRIHLLSGIAPPGAEAARLRETLLANLDWAARQAPAGLALLIEPINGRDMPGYFLQRQAEAHAIVEALGRPNLQVQMDLYHCQITEGDVAAKLRRYLPTGRVGHLQIAAVPDRGEPDAQGELNYPWLFALLDGELGWEGFIGCEYRPRGASTSAGLGWLAPWR